MWQSPPDLLAPLRARKLAALAEGQDLIDLSMFNPDIPPPRFMLDKLIEAATKPHLHRYAVSRGINKLREAFAKKYEARFGVVLDSERELCVTLGSKDAIVNFLRAVSAPGEVAVCVTPLYPGIRSAAEIGGVRLCPVPLGEDELALAEAIGAAVRASKARIILLNFPHNPSGQTVSRKFWERVAEIAQEHGALVYNDFVYGELMHHSASAESALSAATGRTVCVESYSLSKAYGVPGWRVAALSGAPRIIGRISELKATLDFGLFLPVQLAASAALESQAALTASVAAEYRARAFALVMALRRLGFEVRAPEAGGCVWARTPPSLRRVYDESREPKESLAEFLVRRAGVVLAPGDYYAASLSERMTESEQEWGQFLRFALVAPVERLREVAARLEVVCGGRV
jgi:alanine-synthesizing transaminase